MTIIASALAATKSLSSGMFTDDDFECAGQQAIIPRDIEQFAEALPTIAVRSLAVNRPQKFAFRIIDLGMLIGLREELIGAPALQRPLTLIPGELTADGTVKIVH